MPCDFTLIVDEAEPVLTTTLFLEKSVEFLVWLLPLGAFIDPSKEKLACGGQRAICLCSLVIKHQGQGNAKIMFKSNSETQKEKLNPSSSHYLFFARSIDLKNIQEIPSLEGKEFLYNLLVCRPIDQVPKI